MAQTYANKKIKNATIYSYLFRGPISGTAKDWRKKYPNDVIFRSQLEFDTYCYLRQLGIQFDYEKYKLEIIPKYSTLNFQLDPLVLKQLAKDLRGKSKEEKTRIRSAYTRTYPKNFYTINIQAATWTPDFYLPDYKLFLETKGFANDAFADKFKLARLRYPDYKFVVAKTISEVTKILNVILK